MFVPEGDVLCGEGDGGGGAGGAGAGVFADAKEEEEGDVDGVGLGLVVGVVSGVGVCPTVLEDPVDYGDREGELRFRGWVLALVPSRLLSELFPVGLCVGLVGGVGAVVQLEGLANGANRILN